MFAWGYEDLCKVCWGIAGVCDASFKMYRGPRVWLTLNSGVESPRATAEHVLWGLPVGYRDLRSLAPLLCTPPFFTTPDTLLACTTRVRYGSMRCCRVSNRLLSMLQAQREVTKTITRSPPWVGKEASYIASLCEPRSEHDMAMVEHSFLHTHCVIVLLPGVGHRLQADDSARLLRDFPLSDIFLILVRRSMTGRAIGKSTGRDALLAMWPQTIGPHVTTYLQRVSAP